MCSANKRPDGCFHHELSRRLWVVHISTAATPLCCNDLLAFGRRDTTSGTRHVSRHPCFTLGKDLVCWAKISCVGRVVNQQLFLMDCWNHSREMDQSQPVLRRTCRSRANDLTSNDGGHTLNRYVVVCCSVLYRAALCCIVLYLAQHMFFMTDICDLHCHLVECIGVPLCGLS